MTPPMILTALIVAPAWAAMAWVIVDMWRRPSPPPPRKVEWLRAALKEIDRHE